MIWLPMHYTSRPPLRLRLLWVTFGARGRSGLRPASVIGMPYLLARLDELDKCLCNNAAVDLLEVSQRNRVVLFQSIGITDFKRDPVYCSARRRTWEFGTRVLRNWNGAFNVESTSLTMAVARRIVGAVIAQCSGVDT